MEWVPDSDDLVVQQLNRRQNTLEVMLGDAATGEVRTVFTDRDEAWVDVHDDLNWFDHGQAFTWTADRDGWRHLDVVRPRESGPPRRLTRGDFDVIDVVGVDEKARLVYFMASPENPTQSYLYRVPLDGSGKAEPRDPAGSAGHARLPDLARRPVGDPHVLLVRQAADHRAGEPARSQGRAARSWATPSCGRSSMRWQATGASSSASTSARAWSSTAGASSRPASIPPKKYPVLVHVYGEPAGQTVLDRWGGELYLWHRMLAQQGYVVLSVDNRGTPAPRGRAWRKCVYRQVGILASARPGRRRSRLLEGAGRSSTASASASGAGAAAAR